MNSSLCLPTYLPSHGRTHPFIDLSLYIHLSIYLPINPFIHCVSVHVSPILFIHLSPLYHLLIYLPTSYECMHPLINLSFIHPSITYPSIYHPSLFIHPFINLSLNHVSIHLSIQLSINSSIHLLIMCPSIHLSICSSSVSSPFPGPVIFLPFGISSEPHPA